MTRLEELNQEISDLFGRLATALRKKDFSLEEKIDAEIKIKIKEKLSIENNTAREQYKNLDIADEIKKAKKTHDWTQGKRCIRCIMKEETFQLRSEKILNYWKDYPSEAIVVLDQIKCEEKP